MNNSERQKALQAIKHALVRNTVKGMLPYRWIPLAVFCFGFIGVVFLLPPSPPLSVQFGSLIFVGVFSYILLSIINRYSKYQSWDQIIYDLLSNYDPANVEAYSELQKLARYEKLTGTQIDEWIAVERDTIEPRQPTAAELSQQRFSDRKI